MQIHTVNAGETLYSIARRYSVPATKILSDNGFVGDRLTVGDEVLILTPTRTVTVRGGDTLESISKRFNIKTRTLLTQNPSLCGKHKLRPGQILTIKQDTTFIGAGSSLGIIKKGCGRDKLYESLPYMTYAVIDAATVTDTVNMTFNPEYAVNLTKSEGKIVILGVKDKSNGLFLTTKEGYTNIISSLINIAKSHGFMGIRISCNVNAREKERFSEFLLEARKCFIGCDMVLFTDVSSYELAEASELSDGAILTLDNIHTLDESKKRIREFAGSAESSKVFVSLPSSIELGDGKISIDEAKELCYRSGKSLKTNNDTMLSEFEYTRYKTGKGERYNIAFPSLQYIKAKLEALCELGFIGISFDVDTRPTSYLTIFNALFARADYAL